MAIRVRFSRQAFKGGVSDVYGVLFWAVAAILLIAFVWSLAFSLIGGLLSLTLGQVLIVGLAFWLGWWVRGRQ